MDFIRCLCDKENRKNENMITDFFLRAIHALVFLVMTPVRLLPNASLPQAFLDATSSVGDYIAPLNNILPLSAFTSVLVAFLALEGAIFAWGGINWILRRIPTQS